MTQSYKHPSFPEPDSPDTVICRYSDYNKFKWLIECGRLFMPGTENLGDPLEGTRPIGESYWWQNQLDRAKSKDQRAIIEHNSRIIQRFAAKFRQNYFVSCWHINDGESKEMWHHYTSCHESVAILSRYWSLKTVLPEYVHIGVVRYIDFAEEKLPFLNMFDYIMHKDVSFMFENELRAVAFPPATEELGRHRFREHWFEMEKNPEFLVYAPTVDLQVLVQQVVLHPDADSGFEDRVARLCESNGLPSPARSGYY